MSKAKHIAESILIALWVIALTSLIIVGGCSIIPGPSEPPFPWQQRFMADVAIVASTSDVAPGPRPQPKIGDRCRDCNDPPGACGVGRVGDGRDCSRCGTCGGDGRIDEQDLTGDFGDEPLPPARSIILRMSYGSQGWGADWWLKDSKSFSDAGWDVQTLIDTENVTPAPYFIVVDGDASTQFHEPLTAELLESWTR
jgi:hypothetical protein